MEFQATEGIVNVSFEYYVSCESSYSHNADYLEIYYGPKICAGVHLRASLFFHFHSRQYSGTNQMVSLLFNLNELMEAVRSGK